MIKTLQSLKEEKREGQYPEPSLINLVKHMEKSGDHLKGKGNGGVKWVADDE